MNRVQAFARHARPASEQNTTLLASHQCVDTDASQMRLELFLPTHTTEADVHWVWSCVEEHEQLRRGGPNVLSPVLHHEKAAYALPLRVVAWLWHERLAHTVERRHKAEIVSVNERCAI